MNAVKLIKSAAVAAAALAAAGCLGATKLYETRPPEETVMLDKGRMFRGRVDRVVSDDTYQKSLDSYSDREYLKLSGVTKEENRNKRLVSVSWLSELGREIRGGLLVPREADIAKGDIIDFRDGVLSEKSRSNVRNRENLTVIEGGGVSFVGDLEFLTDIESAPFGDGDESPEFLGIVCRAGERGCTINSSPGTTIGIGRVLTSADDYRGAEAESGQEMFQLGTNLGEFLGVNVCFECDSADDTALSE